MGTTETVLVYQIIIFELVVPSQPLFDTRGATHCFSQHLLVRPIVFYNTSNSIKTRLLKWKQGPGIQSWNLENLFSDFQELLNGIGLSPGVKDSQGQGTPRSDSAFPVKLR